MGRGWGGPGVDILYIFRFSHFPKVPGREGATSKHTKKYEISQRKWNFKVRFQKNVDGQVEESVPQVPVAGKIIDPPK